AAAPAAPSGHPRRRPAAPGTPARGCSRRRSRSAATGWRRSPPRARTSPSTAPPWNRPPAPAHCRRPRSATTAVPPRAEAARASPLRSPRPTTRLSLRSVSFRNEPYRTVGSAHTDGILTAMTDTSRTGRDADPRRQRARSRPLDAASNLLSTGGVAAVTIEAVTRASKVARTTWYRHFPDSAALITAAFQNLLPPLPPLAEKGPLRARLIELLDHI